MKLQTRSMVKTAILSAIAIILMQFEFPIFFLPPFLKMDFSDLPAILASFSMGPISGVLVELIKNVLHFITKGSETGGVGQLANFIVGSAFVIPAGVIYKKNRSKKSALWGLIIGSLSMTVFAVMANYFILLPFYINQMNFPLEAIIGMSNKINPLIKDMFTLIVFGITPFNLLKNLIISVITMFIYKPLSPILKK